MAEYASSWPGKVTSIVRIDHKPSTEMDLVEIDPEETQPAIEIRPTNPSDLSNRLSSAAVVFAGLTGDEARLGEICVEQGIPLVVNSEYTLRTQEQIVEANARNFLLRFRRIYWTRRNHRKTMRLLSMATSLQCSGTPTYNEYRGCVEGALLFFDNRVRARDVISEKQFHDRLGRVGKNKPLRIVFGGRLVPMKGVLDLPLVAAALRAQGLPFQMDIVGAGPLRKKLKNSIDTLRLHNEVALHEPMDFRSGWIPFLKQNADIFVCCHRQGDPSSTYPEVMSCGVPIIGYENEALVGLQELCAGVLTTPADPDQLAAKIIESSYRSRLTNMSPAARNFAIQHTFEQTFLRRVGHMVKYSRLDPAIKAHWFEKDRL